MSLIQELLALHESSKGFKLYTEHPYGNGIMDTPVKKGETLPCEDGSEVTFKGITANGHLVIVTGEDGDEEITPEAVNGTILPAGESVKGKKGFVAMGGKMMEAAQPKLYVQHPYGHGFDSTAVTKGEWLPREDGEDVAFVKVAPGGKTIMAKNRQGQIIEVPVADVDGKVLPAGEKPTPGKNGFMMNEAKENYKLYTEHPYGNGTMDTPVKRGEILPTEDGDEVQFIRVSDDGKKLVVLDKEDEIMISPKRVGGTVLPAGESVKGKKSFVAMKGKMFD